ncbi:MAG: hydroxymyristoyl-ACP dehydratase, partial [Bacteroidales bacterium]|nr:hydroxymyristoyl-ACP dehydratase [Bacteroidales bacterium]
GVITGFYINEDNILVRNGFLSEAGLTENIAQSAALMIGWNAHNNENKNDDAPLGVIGGIKNLQINFLPKIKSEIITEIKILHEVLNARIISGLVITNDKVCMECEMKIFLTTEE